MAVDLPPPTDQDVLDAFQAENPALNHVKATTQDALQHFEAQNKVKVVLASNTTPKEKHEKYDSWGLEEVYQDNLKYLNYYFNPLKLAYDTEKSRKTKEIIKELKALHNKLGGETDLNRLSSPLDMVLAMEDEYFEMVSNDKKTSLKLLKRELRNFTFELIDIIKPYLKWPNI